MTYVTREVEEITAAVTIFDKKGKSMDIVEFTFYDGENEKQIEKAVEKMGYKVLDVEITNVKKYIGRMSKETFALYCEYYKDER